MNNQSDAILEQACLWLSKINSGKEYDAIAFSLWLEADDAHLSAFNEVNENWLLLQHLKPTVTRPEQVKPNKVKYSQLITLGVAACILLFISSLFLMPNTLQTETYITQKNQSKTLQLSDGSQVTLNADSKLVTQFDQQQRVLILARGDAHFEVAKDAARPFIVKYKQHSFTALGTAFNITTRPQLMLQVTEHSVAVDTNNKQQIVQQQHALSYNTDWQTISNTQAQQITAWRQNKIVFEQQPLHLVLAQLSPYLVQPIELINLGQRNELVSGSFEVQQAEQALQMIALGLDLKVKQDANGIMLY